ncbi:MAG: UDP-N-acetylglucosamine--N-acetylmuramyl-(pentapeptide) pyrophosphoryl-undecaprenol N-acetylglucosamine transferase [Candidatus Kerfeldbacteria bacterium]|nr:UDP-N-acetylglucosamine--N-acetylmuramyl-(pentapeptide) pyrophosphoryl-undecaprenol N-acetylglucosamine transferase [Candidatus Kerfeldbacteria bacterium]
MTYQIKDRQYCFVGGGTMGSLAPLLAVAVCARKQHTGSQIRFLVSRNPVERTFIASEGFSVQSVPSGKLRRYPDWRNVTDFFIIAWAFLYSLGVLRRLKPHVVVSAGSHVAVPVSWAAWVLRIPVVIHQQDVKKGFANRLMSPFASRITVTFAPSVHDFPGKKTLHTGNPVRAEVYLSRAERARQQFGLSATRPLLLVLGGSSGAAFLNELTERVRSTLLQHCEIVHLVGNKARQLPDRQPGYYPIRFLPHGVGDLLAAATCVVARAGLSTLSELAALGKPALLIPMPGTHQEANADYAAQCGAAIRLDQRTLTNETFVAEVTKVLFDAKVRSGLSHAMRGLAQEHAAEDVLAAIQKVCKRP